MGYDNEYPLAKKYIYKWEEIVIGRLDYLGDAITVDGDRHIVICYTFKNILY